MTAVAVQPLDLDDVVHNLDHYESVRDYRSLSEIGRRLVRELLHTRVEARKGCPACRPGVNEHQTGDVATADDVPVYPTSFTERVNTCDE